MKYLLIGILLSLLGCASKPKIETKPNKEIVKGEKLYIQKDYIVKDASNNERPAWISNLDSFVTSHNMNGEKFRYFVFETSVKIDRELACNFAKANARVDIASEIATFIQKTLGASKEGRLSINENNPRSRNLKEYVWERQISYQVFQEVQLPLLQVFIKIYSMRLLHLTKIFLKIYFSSNLKRPFLSFL